MLVVDDEQAILLLCRVNLMAAGMEVLEAANGPRALELARGQRPDLVLLDVMLPGIDGWRVAEELRADPATSDIPVVFLTAHAERADRVRAQELGGVGFVKKPFDPASLGEVVERVLTRLARGERDELRREILEGP